VYLLYKEVFSGESKTSHFNRAVDRVRTDNRAVEVLGPGTKIRAFGEPTSNKWARARPIAYVKPGKPHFALSAQLLRAF